jgi:hypothetical protein
MEALMTENEIADAVAHAAHLEQASGLSVDGTPLSLNELGFVHGRRASMTVVIPGLNGPDGKPLELTEVYVVEEVGDGWVSARPLDDENLLIFGEHPLALFEITKLVLCPQVGLESAVNPLVRSL